MAQISNVTMFVFGPVEECWWKMLEIVNFEDN